MNRILISFSFGLMLAVLVHAQSTPNLTCDDIIGRTNYEKVGDNYFHFATTKLNWFDASDYCRLLKGNLASLESKAKQVTLVNHMLSKKYSDVYWLSGNDLGTEDDYYWFGTGNTLNLTETIWLPNEPSDSLSNEDCVTITDKKAGSSFKLNDENCANAHVFICEANKLPVWNF